MADGSPKPFSITLHPAPASARAMPSPIPLVEPVMIAALPFGIVFATPGKIKFQQLGVE
jgi:hypothetical protein